METLLNGDGHTRSVASIYAVTPVRTECSHGNTSKCRWSHQERSVGKENIFFVS